MGQVAPSLAFTQATSLLERPVPLLKAWALLTLQACAPVSSFLTLPRPHHTGLQSPGVSLSLQPAPGLCRAGTAAVLLTSRAERSTHISTVNE